MLHAPLPFPYHVLVGRCKITKFKSKHVSQANKPYYTPTSVTVAQQEAGLTIRLDDNQFGKHTRYNNSLHFGCLSRSGFNRSTRTNVKRNRTNFFTLSIISKRRA